MDNNGGTSGVSGEIISLVEGALMVVESITSGLAFSQAYPVLVRVSLYLIPLHQDTGQERSVCACSVQ